MVVVLKKSWAPGPQPSLKANLLRCRRGPFGASTPRILHLMRLNFLSVEYSSRALKTITVSININKRKTNESTYIAYIKRSNWWCG